MASNHLMKYPAVESVIPKEGFVLEVTFDNNESGVLDMKPYLAFGVFKRIQVPEKFKKVKISFDTIEWESGVDLDPRFVYEKTRITPAKLQ